MRAAVLGSPVAHSLSPVLHAAAYAALGLRGWTYERVECDAAALPGWIAARDATWAGVSVTMPGKRAALQVATTVSVRARVVGAANTLVRGDDGAWSADCTDVDGVAGALRAAGVHTPTTVAADLDDAVVLGGGGTACAVVRALYDLGLSSVTVVVRDPARAVDVLAVADRVGLRARATTFDALGGVPSARTTALVNTTPGGAVDGWAERLVAGLPSSATVLDAVYHPWPTRLVAAAGARGLRVATGLDMLLHQAFGQVEQFTGRPAPRAAMHAALTGATGCPVHPTTS